ncbi:MFS transporter [Tumebacillus sp. ITR2]|uniref:MFS transporter n=1 Tax=Tumebacillus amylolyticus TaxID=2801339 RepID=A0ABS1J965_9BACL|nr:MFS transporter [Tumebacillus amylolyticus]MBL0386813.1 MFS transporter [Tumebacillus amylolyticus]
MGAFLKGNPRFLRYWISTWTSEGGDWIRNMVMMFIVLELSGGSAISFSINMFCEFAPIFLFGFVVGVFADRWKKKRTILSATLFRMGMMVLLIGAILLRSLVLIYAISFVSAIGTLFFRAAAPAFTMLFVPQEDRQTASSLRQMSMSTMLLIGSPIATLLYMQIGAAWSLGITIALFIASWVLVQSVNVEETMQEAKSQKSMAGVWAEMKDGFRYSWHNSVLRPLMVSSILFGFGAGLITVLEIFITTDFLGLPKEMMGALVMIQGVGMLLSSLVLPKVKLSMQRFVSWGMVITGIGLGGMVAYPSFYATAFALIVFSLGQIGLNIGMATLMQTQVNFEYQGRAGMTINTIVNGFQVLAMFGAGWLNDFFTVQPVVAAGGIIMALGGVLCAMMFKRDLEPTI